MPTQASIGTPALWAGFLAVILALLALDLGVFHRSARRMSVKESLCWSAFWVSIAGLFNLAVFSWHGTAAGVAWTTGYLIEKSLSLDNVFVFTLVFAAFQIPLRYQYRVLFWGILGALVMRAVFVVVGASLLERFHGLIYLFGLFLLVSGVKMLSQQAPADPLANPVARAVTRVLPMTSELHGEKFAVKLDGRWHGTPLLGALLVIEACDLVFAVDSIPAIFAVTRDPFIVFTANVFAVMGLRALYFLLADAVHRFHHLRIGLAVVLAFVGVKMMLVDLWPIPVFVSLTVISAVLTISVLASIIDGGDETRSETRPEPTPWNS